MINSRHIIDSTGSAAIVLLTSMIPSFIVGMFGLVSEVLVCYAKIDLILLQWVRNPGFAIFIHLTSHIDLRYSRQCMHPSVLGILFTRER